MRSGQTKSILTLNLGGEDEVPDCLNQQPHWRDLSGTISRTGQTLGSRSVAGIPFLFCKHDDLPFPDSSIGMVLTNNVPIDQGVNIFGPTIVSSEIKRVLESGGSWQDNGVIVYRKP